MLEITIRLHEPVEDEDQFADRLGDLLGASYSVAGGVATVTGYTEDGDSPSGRVRQAVEFTTQIRQLGCRPEACDPDLVDLKEIAARVDRTHETVRLWAAGERRTSGPEFPPPLFTLAGGQALWTWERVNSWLRSAAPELADDVALLTRMERKAVDTFIAAQDRPTAALLLSTVMQAIADTGTTSSPSKGFGRLAFHDVAPRPLSLSGLTAVYDAPMVFPTCSFEQSDAFDVVGLQAQESDRHHTVYLAPIWDAIEATDPDSGAATKRWRVGR